MAAPNPVKVIIFGATGMVGQGVLRECLRDPDVTAILTVGRTLPAQSDPKLQAVIHRDLASYETLEVELAGYDACFFCLGVSASGKSEAQYRAITYDGTLAPAEVLARLNPGMIFCYVSGQGTDSTERGKVMWARVKGATENALKRLRFRAVYLLRPGMIQPLHGIKSKTPLYRIIYLVLAPVLPLLRRLFPKAIVTTEQLGRAMIRLAQNKPPTMVLETRHVADWGQP